jgi:hypothetical protein
LTRLTARRYYTQFATFQPTFLYELVWNLALAGVLAWLVRSRRVRSPGVVALYVAGYSAFRILEEEPADRLFGIHPWDAAELLDRDFGLAGGLALVPRGPARLGRRRARPADSNAL